MDGGEDFHRKMDVERASFSATVPQGIRGKGKEGSMVGPVLHVKCEFRVQHWPEGMPGDQAVFSSWSQ